ncbi:MAG: NAD+ synthase, partial [Deltaproteobacteria bacterium]
MRVCVAQYNPTVGDLAGNAARLLAACRNAGDLQADLLVAPELALCGYPPRDLLDRPSFVRDCLAMLHHVVHSAPIPLLFGAVVGAGVDVFDAGSRIANGAVLAQGGEVRACHRKNLLPTYDVFDEARYFTPGTKATTAMVGEHRIGISVCEDIWNDKAYWSWARYDRDPVAESVAAGAELLINLSASPFHRDKPQQRLQMLAATAKRHARPILYVNQVGGNDSLIFDGRSLAVQGDGRT